MIISSLSASCMNNSTDKYYLLKLWYLTGEGKEGNCDPEVFFKKRKASSVFLKSVPLHLNAISGWLSDNSLHVVTALLRRPCALVTSCIRVKWAPLCVLQSCGESNIGHLLSGNHRCFKSCGGRMLSENADKYQMIPIVLRRRGHYQAGYYHCSIHAVVSGLHCV